MTAQRAIEIIGRYDVNFCRDDGEPFPAEELTDAFEAALDALRSAPRDVKIVALGDKLSNMRAIARDYLVYGDKFWEQFHAKDPRSHAWRYRALVEAMAELKGTGAFEEFACLVEHVFTKACHDA